MNSASTPKAPGVNQESDGGKADSITLNMIDRSSPRWAVFLGVFFTAGGLLCLFALPVLAVFFVSIVAEGGETGMVPVLALVGSSFLVGMLVLDYAHTRALAGYRQTREDNARWVKAGLAVFVFLVFSVLHPLMGLAIPLGAGIGAGGQYLLSRYARSEPFWDFLPAEAVSILSGRDYVGAKIAARKPGSHALEDTIKRASSGLAVLFSVAIGSYLIAGGVITLAALLPLLVGTLWSVEAIVAFAAHRFSREKAEIVLDAEVRQGALLDETASEPGLTVYDLSVKDMTGRPLISNVGFTAVPGSVTGILGESGAGKSLLMRALADPFSLPGMEVSGNVRMGGVDLWRRRAQEHSVPAVLLPSEPLLLPASGAENLACFHDGAMLERGKWLLEQIVFATDMVESICDEPNAQHLPTTQIKALALARAFLLAPQLYLMDRPEDGLPEKQIAALLRRMQEETRLGRSIILATENRALLDSCDRLIILQDGRIIDYGEADQVRSRMESGWARFIGTRRLETEDNLENWIRSHFRRDGDEANRRKVCMIASEMLALSCATADGLAPGHVSFMFKHFENYCLLKLQDTDGPISAPQIQLAQKQAEDEADTGKTLPPLAAIFRGSEEVELGTQLDNRVIEAKISTYDPRKGMPTDAGHATTA